MISRREHLVNYAILIAFSLFALYPVVGVLTTALADPGTASGFSLSTDFHWANFRDAWNQGHFSQYLRSSVIVSVNSCASSWRRVAPSERRTAISISRLVARAMSKFAMFAQAMSSTSPVIANNMNNGPLASSAMSLWPLLPGVRTTCRSRKRANIESRMLRWSGASTSRMIG